MDTELDIKKTLEICRLQSENNNYKFQIEQQRQNNYLIEMLGIKSPSNVVQNKIGDSFYNENPIVEVFSSKPIRGIVLKLYSYKIEE